MTRQFPSKQKILEIADAAAGLATVLRNHWWLEGASVTDNPARASFPENASPDSAQFLACLRGMFDEVNGTNGTLGRLLQNVEPDDRPDDMESALLGREPISRRPNVVAGWPRTVNTAISRLKETQAIVRSSLVGRPAWQPTKVSAENVVGIEWAAGVLRDVATARRKRLGNFTTSTTRRRRRPLLATKGLTEKQVEAVQIVGECKGSIADAARRLGKDPSTIRQHYSAAQKKLGTKVIKAATRPLTFNRRGQENLADGDDRRQM